MAALINALQRCRERGASVVSVSISGLDLATGDELDELENRILGLTARGINVVAGAGNNGGAIGYPARFESVLSVGAGDVTGALCDFSNRGEGLDLFALGCDVEISWPHGGLGSARGTSYSTPTASAVLAALRAYKPSLDAGTAERLLVDSSRRGRLDAEAAFRAAGLAAMFTVDRSAGATGGVPATIAPERRLTTVHDRDALAELGVEKPRLRSASFRRNTLRVLIRNAPDFGRAVFRVDQHVFVRRTGRLTLHLRKPPRQISVWFDVPSVGRTKATTIRIERSGRRAAR